jgi:hypothetical protein
MSKDLPQAAFSLPSPYGEGPALAKETNAVMTGLVPVIPVVKLPGKLRIGRKPSRVDGRDEPGHDGEGG